MVAAAAAVLVVLTFTARKVGMGPWSPVIAAASVDAVSAAVHLSADEDSLPDGDDCAPADPATLVAPSAVLDLTVVHQAGTTTLGWDDQSGTTGPSLRYDLLGGDLSSLAVSGLATTACVVSTLENATHEDLRPDPLAGDGYYYLIRAVNPCGVGDLGAGREALESLVCP